MTATLTWCPLRKMLSSVCLLPIPLAFHYSMLNVLSDMVGVWAGLGGGEGARDCGGVIQAVQIKPLALRYSAAFRRLEHLECTQCEHLVHR